MAINVYEEIKKIFLQVNSAGNFDLWLDKSLPSLNMQTPRAVIESGKPEIVINTLIKFIK